MLARAGGPVAAYRFVVNPNVVGDVLSRGLVFRHELVHVALGTTDDRAPRLAGRGGGASTSPAPRYPVDDRRLIAAAQLVCADGSHARAEPGASTPATRP